jgi:hypothetical protein
MSRDWISDDGQIIHPSAPQGAGGPGHFAGGKQLGSEVSMHGIAHPRSPAGRNGVVTRTGGRGPLPMSVLYRMIVDATPGAIKNPLVKTAYDEVQTIPDILSEESRVWAIITIIRDTVRDRMVAMVPAANLLHVDVNPFALDLIMQFRNEMAIPGHCDTIYAYVDHFYQSRAEMSLFGPGHEFIMRLKSAGYDMAKVLAISLGFSADDLAAISKLFHLDSKNNCPASPPTLMSGTWAERGLQMGEDDYSDDLKAHPDIMKEIDGSPFRLLDRQKKLFPSPNP